MVISIEKSINVNEQNQKTKRKRKSSKIEHIEFEFGVMSSKYKLVAPDLRTARLAMILFLSTEAPIVIYSPETEKRAFDPKSVLREEFEKRPPKDLRKVFETIVKIL